ncbi:UNVERIFIED_CONTAM: protein FAR1-RELATED SEQUENCE 3 [Sesamum angustifolium]|uniref:Protein FAR1-RELATED SEQUENCE n=1 Tax=Sesamum angustifolium TaxID=2727405 RepID=A0AAW2QQX3_9LAMI
MQAENPGFYYAIQLDDENRMANTFWADARSRTAYSHFGDAVTLETTYRTNRYTVPFAPFTGTFLAAMNDRAPVSLTTDKDRAIQAAVTQVFPEARHCVNKWHVLREGEEKMAHVCLAHPNFQAELCNCINMTETIEEFESFWTSILDKQYERALENSFEREVEADFDTICTTPVLRTPSPMEKQAANLYTKRIFSKFQEELVETFVYTANRVDGDGHNSTYRVAKFEDDHKAYFVSLNIAEMKANCSSVDKKCQTMVVADEHSEIQVSGTGYDDRRPSIAKPEMTPLLWPRQDEIVRRFNLNDASVPGQPISNSNVPRVGPVSLKRDVGHNDTMVVLPCLKSMTWVMENKNSTPADRVAVINLKLQDYARAPAGESEVKFSLSSVTLEPMLRSMAYISEQLSTPANKVAVINLKLQDTETTSGESEVKFQVSRDTLGAMLRSMAYIREQLSNTVEPRQDNPTKRLRK